jgi:glycosyltransferase involved in cell wall biosynthesis
LAKAKIKPVVSIIIPCFKRADLLNWGLYSLSKQKCKYPFEVLVLNDGIEDETKSICDKYADKLNIRYIFTGYRNKEKIVWRCPGFPLNIGVKKARANFIILTCAEIFHLDVRSIEKTVEVLKQSRRIMVRPRGKDDQKNEYLQHVIKTKGEVDFNYDINPMVDLDTKLPFFLGLHKEEFMNIGGYDEDFIGWAYDDTDFTIRMQKYGIKYIQINADIIHLYHPRHRMGIQGVQKMYQHNKKLYEYKWRNGVVYSNVGRDWGILKRFEKIEFLEDKIDVLWKFKKIPKIAHFYWGNDKLPYLRYLTILSFKIHNPEWKIKFYVPPKKYGGKCLDTQQAFQFTGRDYYPNLRTLKNVEIITVDIPFINNLVKGLEGKHLSRQEVYRSDFLRWYLLATEGGMWADMDVMFFKPISDMYINQKGNENIETLISLHPTYGHSVGFMLSAPNNPYYTHILETAKKNFNPGDYQSVGVNLLNKDFPTVKTIENRFPSQKGKVMDVPVTTVYAYDALVIPTIYNYQDMRRYTQHSIALHWYAGHHLAKKYVNAVNHLNYANYKNVLCRTIGKVYGGK